LKNKILALLLLTVMVFSPVRDVMAAGFSGMQVQGNSPVIAKALGFKDASGVFVRDVAMGGPAAKAGFRRGDLIISFDGVEVDSFDRLVVMIGKTRPGQSVKMIVLRGDKKIALSMTLSQRPPEYSVTKNSIAVLPVFGVTMAAITPKIRKRFELRWASVGVLITLVDEKFKDTLGLRSGDVIVQINRQTVWDPAQVVEFYKRAKENKKQRLLLMIDRRGSYEFRLLKVR